MERVLIYDQASLNRKDVQDMIFDVVDEYFEIDHRGELTIDDQTVYELVFGKKEELDDKLIELSVNRAIRPGMMFEYNNAMYSVIGKYHKLDTVNNRVRFIIDWELEG